MQFLKSTFVLLLICFSTHTFAQDYAAMQTAFSKSYANEVAGKFDEAIGLIKAVATENSYECNVRLGWLYYLAGKQNESLSFYQKAITAMPSATEPLWGIVNPYAVLGKWADVQKAYMSILALDPKNSVAHYRLGLSYYYAKDYVSAKKYFDVSLNLYPLDYNNLIMSAWTNLFLGKMNEAKVLFNKTLIVKPNDTSALDGLKQIK